MARMNLEHVAEIERFRQQIEKMVLKVRDRYVCMSGTGLLIYSKSIQLIDNVLLLHIYNVIHQLCIIMYELYQELLMHIYIHLQAAIQEGTATSLRQELESRDSELSILRNKTNSLTMALADLKKQLTISEQEVQAVKREAETTLH